MLSSLEKVLKSLKSSIHKGEKINYVIPDIWNTFNYERGRKLPTNEILVNPYDFYAFVIEDYILKNKQSDLNYLRPLSKVLNDNKNWIKEAVCYSMMARTTTTYDHDRSFTLDLNNFDGLKETGSFVKSIAYLPTLKKLGVNTIYMLPISKFSVIGKKGDLGSPYGVEDFFEIDPLLKDDLSKESLETEFKAFVEACHILSMRVVIDIIPRTNSVASALINEHPDWFYWIKSSEMDKYKVPTVDTIGACIPPTKDIMKEVYKSADVKRHIKMFKKNPKEQNEALWNEIKSLKGEELIEAIKVNFDLEIAKAFSDNINDPQPAWTDVTFFRMYLDHPEYTVNFLEDKSTPPYILFDTIKCNLYPGKEPNMGLWNLLSDIIPYFEKNFGIDGARIDMGHALPSDLLNLIMKKAKKVDSNFAFIAEELNPGNDKIAKALGYDMIIGNGFWMEPRITEGKLKDFIDNASVSSLPLFACCETHDTPRIASRNGGINLSRMLTVLNMFIPNTVPFINSGQEIYELQAMNLGIDASIDDMFRLEKDDYLYGKLALFDMYAFHYTNPRRFEIINHFTDVIKVREKWLKVIIDLNNYQPLIASNKIIAYAYLDYHNKKALIILANQDIYNANSTQVSLKPILDKLGLNQFKMQLRYATYEFPHQINEISANNDLYQYLKPCEVKIIEI